ncbi:coiled-coil domain-containing protein [Candidatus Phytoplasma sp. AldY-WA1]|uniref:coiled-coil domain-containing protein n=1 Tax=Candidatus Phytoplasma sp. AldY-WA1 TaxID=2852100 RepID=UPI0025515790|nr:hypothetical protein [Candidatus Phytoplasma sp. AldY-WA1]
MISITKLLFSYYKIIISFIAIIPIIFLIHGIYQSSRKKIIISVVALIILFGLFSYIRKKDPSSKYADITVNRFDDIIYKLENVYDNFEGTKSQLKNKLEKINIELTELQDKITLTEEQETKIKELLDKNENTFQEIDDKIKDNNKNICFWHGQLINLEEQKIQNKNLKTQDEQIRELLQKEIDRLTDELHDIVEPINLIKPKIKELESQCEKFNEMLVSAEKIKQDLEHKYKNLTSKEQTVFNQIKTEEQHLKEYKNLIVKSEVKRLELINKTNHLKLELELAKQCKLAWDDYNKKHKFSFENPQDALFERFEIYQNTFTAKMFKNITNDLKKHGDKIAITTHEFQRGYNIIKKDYFNDDNTPKMINADTYKDVCNRCNCVIEKHENEFNENNKLIEKICHFTGGKGIWLIEDFQDKQKDINLQKKEIKEDNTNIEIKEKQNVKLNDYTNIVKNLKLNLIENEELENMIILQEILNTRYENKLDEIEARKEVLKSKQYNRMIDIRKQKRCARMLKKLETIKH